MNPEVQAAAYRLRNGTPPGHRETVRDITVGLDYLTFFWEQHYLSEYIPNGGSRIQLLTGSKGSGKSHFIEYFLSHFQSIYICAFYFAAGVV